MAKRRTSQAVFFPWERKRGVARFLARARVQQVLLGAFVLTAFWLLRESEEQRAALRATRASITDASRAMFAYRADHPSACPKSLAELVSDGYARDVPLDSWGRPLRLVCPGRKDPVGFDLSSDGPDGLPGGLDRVE